MKDSSNVTDWLVSKSFVRMEEKEIIEFGLNQGLLIGMNIITIMILGVVFGVFPHSVVFLLAFILLRSHAGGYHADSIKRCYLLSIFIISISFCFIKYYDSSKLDCFLLACLSGFFIVKLAPVDTNNNQLDFLETKVYRLRTLKILAVEMVIFLLAIMGNVVPIYESITLAMTITGLLLLSGYIKSNGYKIYKKK